MSEKPFEGVLGNSIQLRLLQHLMSAPKLDFNITELERITGVSRPSVDHVIKMFRQWGIALETDKRGNMKFYSINDESNLVASMRQFNCRFNGANVPRTVRGSTSTFCGPYLCHRGHTRTQSK